MPHTVPATLEQPLTPQMRAAVVQTRRFYNQVALAVLVGALALLAMPHGFLWAAPWVVGIVGAAGSFYLFLDWRLRQSVAHGVYLETTGPVRRAWGGEGSTKLRLADRTVWVGSLFGLTDRLPDLDLPWGTIDYVPYLNYAIVLEVRDADSRVVYRNPRYHPEPVEHPDGERTGGAAR